MTVKFRSDSRNNPVKMKYLFVLTFFVAVAAVTAMPFELAEDEDGEQYYMVPIHRTKRQTNWGLSNTGASIGHKGTVFNNDNHRLDGSAFAGKNFGSHGLRPDQVGGRLDYTHNPSGSGAFVGATNNRGFGTDVNAGGKLNLYQNKNFNVDATAQYGRHFGGPGGTGRPNAGVFLNANGRF